MLAVRFVSYFLGSSLITKHAPYDILFPFESELASLIVIQTTWHSIHRKYIHTHTHTHIYIYDALQTLTVLTVNVTQVHQQPLNERRINSEQWMNARTWSGKLLLLVFRAKAGGIFSLPLWRPICSPATAARAYAERAVGERKRWVGGVRTTWVNNTMNDSNQAERMQRKAKRVVKHKQ